MIKLNFNLFPKQLEIEYKIKTLFNHRIMVDSIIFYQMCLTETTEIEKAKKKNVRLKNII